MLNFAVNLENKQYYPNVLWEKVFGNVKVKEQLRENVILPLKFPQLFIRRQPRTMLLYGVSSTYHLQL